MRLGIIDLGTNSVRFDVYQLGPGKHVRMLHRDKLMVRLGEGVFLNGRLDRNASQRTLQAFLKFQRVGRRLRAEKILAFGTSALREVADRERFVELLKKRSGIDVRVISGAEEAQLIALGILSNERVEKSRYALVDIGGGSTEISICRGREILHSESFPLGTARLQQIFLKRIPPTENHIKKLREYIRDTLHQTMSQEKWGEVDKIIGSSGTIRAVHKLIKKTTKKNLIERDSLRTLVKDMSGMSTTELLNLPGMEAKRVDMILSGSVLFEECMKALGAKRARITEYSLRHGILEEEMRLHRQGKSSHLSLHMEELYDRASHFKLDIRHIKRTVALGEKLFDRLTALHRLKLQWKIYLSAAIIMRDTGEAVGLARHEAHSHYIVKHADLPGMDKWELEMIAQLVLHHEGAKHDPKTWPFKKDRDKRDAFVKLLALLKLVDALDSGAEAHISIDRVQISRTRAQIFFSGRKLMGLEAMNVELRKSFFEKVFKKSLTALRT